jgi:hypothetical protein
LVVKRKYPTFAADLRIKSYTKYGKSKGITGCTLSVSDGTWHQIGQARGADRAVGGQYQLVF